MVLDEAKIEQLLNEEKEIKDLDIENLNLTLKPKEEVKLHVKQTYENHDITPIEPTPPPNKAPTANVGSDINAKVGANITLDGSKSSDDGEIIPNYAIENAN